MTAAASRPSYGFDAPGVMRGLIAAGATGVVVGIVLTVTLSGWLAILGGAVFLAALVPLLLGLSMVAYGLYGKLRVRDLIMSRVAWRGDEQVLDIGTGRGLLLIGAAKKLDRGGRATGIDIWRAKDLSDNTLERLQENIALEGVADRTEVRNEDARALPFAQGTFDVVTSLFCIHNIEDAAERRAALAEAIRVLKPGGRALIGEYFPTTEYAGILREAGMTVVSSRSYFATALSMTWLVIADKPRAA